VDKLAYWVALSKVSGIGRVRFAQLERYFGDLESAWRAARDELRQAGLDSRTADAILAVRSRVSPEAEIERLERHQVRVLTYHDPSYPARLKEIYDYPPVLYVRGDLMPQDECCLAVVGTRRASMYGKQVAAEMTTELARRGVTIVSGLARGIDSIAHRNALEAGGRTIAVFACGLDIVYPQDNAELARQIAHQGALVSEYPLGTRPKADNFPRRNRIMSGMSLGVLVVEAGERSGATITAFQALEQNREVFAVPGSVYSPLSRGTNRLIQEGAKLVIGFADILSELDLTMAAEQMHMDAVLPANDTESLLLKQVSTEPLHIDEICRRSNLPTALVTSTMALMELKGMVRHLGGMNYVLSKG
jgi:DNA processing protein